MTALLPQVSSLQEIVRPRSSTTTGLEVSYNPAVAPLSADLRSLLERVAALTRLAPNWDFDGGVAVSAAAADATRQVLVESHEVCPAPDIMPMHSGAVLLEWRASKKTLHIEISSGGAAQYDRMEGDDIVDEGDLGSDRRSSLFSWLCASESVT